MDEWIAVENGYVDIPNGEWLVYIPKRRNKFHVAVMHTNLQVIGGNFGFDMQRVTHYQALPVAPQGEDDAT